MRVGIGLLFSLAVCCGFATCGVPPLGINQAVNRLTGGILIGYRVIRIQCQRAI